jgi:hypothetical protein
MLFSMKHIDTLCGQNAEFCVSKKGVHVQPLGYELCHRDTGWSGIIAPLFLNSAVDGGEWLALSTYRKRPENYPLLLIG